MNDKCKCERCQRVEVTLDEVLERVNAVLFGAAEVIDDLTLIGDPRILYAFQCHLDDLFRQSADLLGHRTSH